MAERRQDRKPIHAEIGYERRDINIKSVLIVSAVAIGFLLVIFIGLNEYFMITKEEIMYELTLKPESDRLIQLHAREDSILNSYGVIDQQSGVYRIPIERAMEKLVEESSKGKQ